MDMDTLINDSKIVFQDLWEFVKLESAYSPFKKRRIRKRIQQRYESYNMPAFANNRHLRNLISKNYSNTNSLHIDSYIDQYHDNYCDSDIDEDNDEE